MLVLRSLRFKLTLWYVLVLAAILAAFSAGIYLTLRHNLSANLDDSLENRTNVFLDIVRYEGDRPTLAGVVSPVNPDVGEHFVRVYDVHGAVTFDNSAGAGDAPVDQEAGARALSGARSTGSVTVGDDTVRVLTVPLRRNEEVSGVLEVGLSKETMAGTLHTLLLILAVAYPVTLAVASLGGIFLAGRALSPIDRITRLARRISAADLSQRLDVALPGDEVGRLARTFNDMIARLDEAFRRQRQFTADASHELRTPLTAIKGQVEVALSRRREADAYREVLGGVNEEVDRLIRLVGSLLTLARADAGEIPLALEQISLGDLAAAAVSQVQPAAARKGIALRLQVGDDATLAADEDLLLQLLLNLLDNALKFTSADGQVTVGWEADATSARFWVQDNGIGIAAQDHEHIFDRFYRVDRARSREMGGTGLGLSISHWIAEAHGGTISVESSPGQGATFTVILPRIASPTRP